MAERTPKIVNMTLKLMQEEETISVSVGSDAWFQWLETATLFAFHEEGATFTARKQRQGRSWYWYAYARREKLYAVYLGKSTALTADRLCAAMDRLHPSINAHPYIYAADIYGKRSRQAARIQGQLQSLYERGYAHDAAPDPEAVKNFIEHIGHTSFHQHQTILQDLAATLSLAYTLAITGEHDQIMYLRRIAFLEHLLQETREQLGHGGGQGNVF